jgi:hypothetical protein
VLTCYGRAYLGISLGKIKEMLHDFFGLTISRAGLLGHLRWGAQLFAPVVEALFDLLRQSPVVQGMRRAGASTARRPGPGASATRAWPCS